MSPAFSSLKQAVGFVLFLVAMLLLPVLLPPSWLPPREQIYASQPWNVGPYPFLHDQIFKEKSDIDIAIIGDSQIWAAIDTPYLQQQLSEKLGRPAVVVTLCAPWAGFDGLYFLTRDLLQHRKVRMLIFSDVTGLNGVQKTPHKQAWRWFRYAEDSAELTGLSLQARMTYYYGSILGMPHNLLSLLRINQAPVETPEKEQELEQDHHWLMPTHRFGSLAMQISFDNQPDRFSKFTPVTDVKPSDFTIYSQETKDKFRFGTVPDDSLQALFAEKLAALAHAHGTKLAGLNVPFYQDRKSAFILERCYWPDLMHTPVAMVGIAPAVLFDDLPEKDVSNMFWDNFHFNENGQAYFTRLLAPSLISIYDDTTKN